MAVWLFIYIPDVNRTYDGSKFREINMKRARATARAKLKRDALFESFWRAVCVYVPCVYFAEFFFLVRLPFFLLLSVCSSIRKILLLHGVWAIFGLATGQTLDSHLESYTSILSRSLLWLAVSFHIQIETCAFIANVFSAVSQAHSNRSYIERLSFSDTFRSF